MTKVERTLIVGDKGRELTLICDEAQAERLLPVVSDFLAAMYAAMTRDPITGGRLVLLPDDHATKITRGDVCAMLIPNTETSVSLTALCERFNNRYYPWPLGTWRATTDMFVGNSITHRRETDDRSRYWTLTLFATREAFVSPAQMAYLELATGI